MQSLSKRFRKFFGLPFTDQAFLIKTFALIVLIRIGLRLLSFQQFRRYFAGVISSNENIDVSPELIKRRVWAITVISPALYAECLPQALALKYFLKKDKAVKLLIGIAQTNNFAAHAWVEKNDKILIGGLPEKEFQTLWSWN